MNREELKKKWKEVCNQYLKEFCLRHEFASQGWVGDDVGGVAYVDDMCVGMDEIRYDVDNAIPVNEFFGWYDYTSRIRVLELPRTINYASYCKGAPLPYTEEEIKEIERLRERVREAENSLKETMDKLNKDIDDGRN